MEEKRLRFSAPNSTAMKSSFALFRSSFLLDVDFAPATDPLQRSQIRLPLTNRWPTCAVAGPFLSDRANLRVVSPFLRARLRFDGSLLEIFGSSWCCWELLEPKKIQDLWEFYQFGSFFDGTFFLGLWSAR